MCYIHNGSFVIFAIMVILFHDSAILRVITSFAFFVTYLYLENLYMFRCIVYSICKRAHENLYYAFYLVYVFFIHILSLWFVVCLCKMTRCVRYLCLILNFLFVVNNLHDLFNHTIYLYYCFLLFIFLFLLVCLNHAFTHTKMHVVFFQMS